ncbi:protein-arginine omega-N asymmetric methyltransferase [Aureococcus anophagefferens]|nr:protein-arginine omega-N asymmetric methyltransferase [Aureococcus anophagefferens]
MLAAAEALRVEVAAFETERLSEAKAAAFAALGGRLDGDGVLGKEDVASFLKVDEALAVKVMATFDVDEAGALTIDALLPRTNSGDKGTLETVSGALFAVTLKGALRDVLAAEREASRTASDEDASREAAKAEFASVASRRRGAAATAAAAFLLPLFDVANEYGGHLIAGALHGGNPAASAAAGDAMALQLDLNANAALSALAALDLTASTTASPPSPARRLRVRLERAGVKADKIAPLTERPGLRRPADA